LFVFESGMVIVYFVQVELEFFLEALDYDFVTLAVYKLRLD
jgi:hypothetical protein